MLGKYVRVRVVKPIGSTDEKTGYNYPLNYGTVYNTENQGAFIMGIHHPVSNFDGRVIAVLSNRKNGKFTQKPFFSGPHFLLLAFPYGKKGYVGAKF